MAIRHAGGLHWLVMMLSVAIAGVAATLIGPGARAQDQAWVQIEAQPTLAEATERARAYASAFPDVAGFSLRSGWHAIVLGPYGRDVASQRLTEFKRERLIPSDSFVADGRNFRQQFYSTGAEPAPPPQDVIPVDPAPVDPAPAETAAAPVDETPVAETPAQARAAEAALTGPEREALQTALQWFGFYDAAIDGAFGPGTRTAMAAWQQANAAEPTGILTSLQRAALIEDHARALAELGLERVTETEAGIEIDLPLALVAFDRYEPPFVQFTERDGSGVTVLLISQPGDERTLAGLYDSLQSLAIVPMTGPRSRSERSFEITGRDDRIESYTRVELQRGLVKGFTLSWPVQDGARIARVLDAMKTSFRPVGDRALDPGLAPLAVAQKQGMLSGLDVRRPRLSRSGFFVDASGSVLTTAEAVQGCDRLTIEGRLDMTLRHQDPATGLALLAPTGPLAPPAFATFQTEVERQGAEIAVAGYPYEDALIAPTLTFGQVAATTGLNGEAGLKRLALSALPGDAGGPVVDGTGAVVGMLLPRGTDPARVLPADVSFAAAAPALAAFLQGQGITPRTASPGGALPPEDLTRGASAMTVIVSCWD